MNRTRSSLTMSRLTLIYMPLIAAWWIGIQSVKKQFDSGVIGFLLGTVVILAVISLVAKIEAAKQRGADKWEARKWLLFSIIPLMLTIAANFNGIYPKLMKKELYRDEISQKIKYFEMAKKEVESARKVGEIKAGEDLSNQVKGYLEQLHSQIESPGNEGVGKDSESILRQLEAALNVSITRHRSIKKRDAWKRYSVDIKILMDNNSKIKQYERGIKYLEDADRVINENVQRLKKSLDEVDNIEENEGAIKKVIASSVADYARIVSVVKSYNSDAFKNELESLKVENSDVGKITHTLSSASGNWSNPTTWLSLFFALLLDLWGPMFAYFGTSQKRDEGDDLEMHVVTLQSMEVAQVGESNGEPKLHQIK